MKLRLRLLASILGSLCAGCGTVRPSGNPLPPEQIMATLQAAADKLAELVDLNSAEATAAIVAFLHSRPDVSNVQASDGVVWARFSDGKVFGVFNNREPFSDFESTVARTKKSTAAERFLLPLGEKVRMINTFGTAFVSPINDIKPWFEANGYQVNVTNGSIEDFRSMSGEHVLYIDAHGAAIPGGFLPKVNPNGSVTPDPAEHFMLWTSTPATVAGISTYISEMQAGHLAFAVARHDRDGPSTHAIHFMITDLFMKANHWTFSENSLVFMNACQSDQPAVKQVLFDAGVAHYFGWNKSCDDLDAFLAASFFFDRTLGANEIPPLNSPNQRPFTFAAVFDAMKRVKKDLARMPSGNIRNYTPYLTYDTSRFPNDESRSLVVIPTNAHPKLQYTQSPPGANGLLRPSITVARMDEKNDEVQLLGDFGIQDGNVFINGHEINAVSWGASQITIAIPRTGPDSAGDVQVAVRGHSSNKRHLTSWSGQSRYTLTGPGTLHYQITYTTRFRADVGTYRNGCDLPPTAQSFTTYATQAASLTWEAGGAYSSSPSSTETWSTFGPYALAYQIPSALALVNDNWDFKAVMDPEANTCSWGTSTYIKNAYYSQSTGGPSPGNSQPAAAFAANSSPGAPVPRLRSGGSYDIVAGTTFFQQGTLYPRTFDWDTMTAQFPPDPTDEQ